ncbi:MAG: DUF3021 domain-containing protein [Defluviitaleaceae bacterium]|nr:DUF3021 domain-containing protein [Defluviitaleaceae bacterium]
MKKKAILRGLLGIPLGIALGHVITIVISIVIGDGNHLSAIPELVYEFGGELNAVIFQAILYGTLGASFSAASVIWEMERWSIVKQTGLYFLITAATMLPVAYFGHWMERSVLGFVIYFAVFVAIFVFMWLVQYAIWKNKIKHIDSKVKERN